jgi:ABC-type sugar transport system ATPase subunit
VDVIAAHMGESPGSLANQRVSNSKIADSLADRAGPPVIRQRIVKPAPLPRARAASGSPATTWLEMRPKCVARSGSSSRTPRSTYLTGEENIRIHAVLYGLYPYRPLYALMPAAYKRHVSELAGMLGLGKDVFKPVKKLSGGMRRKLEIIRGLMHRPRVLFLDEPTSGLDASSRRNLWEYIADLRRLHDLTVYLTTHQLHEAEAAA